MRVAPITVMWTMPLSDICVCLDEHTVTTNPGNWVINAQWYTKGYVLTHVAQASPYLNSLSKTYIDIYLKYLNSNMPNIRLVYSINQAFIQKHPLTKTFQNTNIVFFQNTC